MSYRIEVAGWGPKEQDGADATQAIDKVRGLVRQLEQLGHQVPKAWVNGQPIERPEPPKSQPQPTPQA